MKTITTKHYWIKLNGDNVYFEHDTVGDECAASIRFELRQLVDYSGVSVIPREVVEILRAEGYQGV